MYCSVSCQETAQSYHAWECKVMTPEFQHDFKMQGVRSVNILAKYGVEKWASFLESQVEVELSSVEEKRTQGFNAEGKYVSSDPNVTYNLSGNRDVKPKNALENMLMLIDTITVAKMLIYLQLDDHSCVKGFANLLYKMKCCSGNDIINEIQEHRKMYADIGIGVFGTFYLLNHSCDPNATNCFFGDTIVVRSQRTIPQGTPVCVSYGKNYRFFPKKVRQEELQELCGFTCDCEACVDNWPTLEGIPQSVSISLPYDLTFFASHQNFSRLLNDKLFPPGADEMVVTKDTVSMVLKHIASMDRYNKRFNIYHVNLMDCVRRYFARTAYEYSAQLL